MFKKNVLGLTILAAGFLLWSCGDGSIDPLSDSEIMMISRFPSTIDYDMLDSIVKACEKDEACWEKAKKTGEIYKGDYTKVLRDSSGNIVIVEGDSAFIYDKSGKKLPVFNFSSNSNDDEGDDVTSSGSTATSGSSSKGSSASGFEKDEGSGYGDNPDSAGSGAGGKSRNHAEESSSSRNGSGNSSSIDVSQYTNTSSSSRGTYTGSMSSHSRSSSSKISSSSVDLSFLSSSSIPTVSMSSIAVVESSSSKQQLSAGSESSQGGGGGNVNLKCGNTPISGKCEPKGKSNPSELYTTYKGRDVTYKYTPDAGTCTETSTIKWIAGDDGASPVSQEGGWEFTTAFSKEGTKTLTYFIMDDTRIPCEEVVVESECVGNNSYTCSIHLNSSSNNLTKANPVSYTWTLTKGGCKDILDNGITWGGSVSGNEMTVSQTFNSAGTYSVSLNVKDEGKPSTGTDVLCSAAVVRNVTEMKPSFNVADIPVAVVGASLTVTPTSVVGCDYDSDKKCSYTLKKSSGSPSVSGTLYQSGALKPITGESTDGTVEYTLTMTNYLNQPTIKTFNVTYVTPVDITATTKFISYAAGAVYRVTVGSEIQNGFGCTVSSSNPSARTIGSFNGVALTIPGYNTASNKIKPSANSTNNIFIVADDAPADLKCGIGW